MVRRQPGFQNAPMRTAQWRAWMRLRRGPYTQGMPDGIACWTAHLGLGLLNVSVKQSHAVDAPRLTRILRTTAGKTMREQRRALELSSEFQPSKTTLGAWVKTICRAMDAAGCDSKAVLAQSGLELRALDGPDVRCPIELSIRLWKLAAKVTQDPAFGVKAASHIKNTSFHALSYGISSSSTLKDAFERALRYSRWVSDVVNYRFVRRGREYHFVMEPTTEVPDESVDCLVAAYLRMCRSLIGRDFSPLRIELRRPAPERIDDFNAILRAPLTFGAPQTRMVFAAEAIERQLDSGNAELAQHNDAIALRYLAKTEISGIQVRVGELLRARLPDGEPTEEEVARLLKMSVRTLQRKLLDNGTTYRSVLDDTRRDLAMFYLRVPVYSLSAVTHMLGYSAPSCLTRAFRRWTGQSPRAWRAAGCIRP